MEKIGLNELRDTFRDFYTSKSHYARKSFSLVPENDKSLLIINSGMAPLKPYFAGLEEPPSKRMTTCQKCIRTGDIENVGYTARHATFFEMLGSFSFGDYFKEESIQWGWEFMTQVLKMPEDKLWPSIYEDDDEAFEIWNKQIGVPEERIVRLGKEDNFWEIGVGPCGPCSEIYFDRGEVYGCGHEDCKPGCDCDRYVEFWNHVFTQFNRDTAGNYTPLKQKNIDTGMGLERLACIMQGVDSIFDVDTIREILNEVVRLGGVSYEEGKAKTDISIRIITDHIRSITFMIGDGILPSNEGRGYVLRRLLRRAARHGKLLGIEGQFLASLSKKVIQISGTAYPEIKDREDYIHRILSIEEEKFSHTIDLGTVLLEEHMEDMRKLGQQVLAGDKAFRLYDTFGFPIELTEEILAEKGFSADKEEFSQLMNQQKETARAARKSEHEEGWSDEGLTLTGLEPTKFLGYETLTTTGTVRSIVKDNQSVDHITAGDVAKVVFDQTPFYAESGGQTSDHGVLSNEASKAEVLSIAKHRDVYLHRVAVAEGVLSVGDSVTLQVDPRSRNSAARNHTATHLLHQALKDVLGQHVEQAGSSVSADGLRFDFTHFEAISKEDLAKIETIVNEKITEFIPVKVEELPLEEAMKTGAAAQFGEKYGSVVRVVSVGTYSSEFCGGTHVQNSGQMGAFKILSESGVAAGVRRIEAITGLGLYQRMNDKDSTLSQASEILKTNPENLLTRMTALIDELKSTKKELDQLRQKGLEAGVTDLIRGAKTIRGVNLITHAAGDLDVNDLRILSDKIKGQAKETVIVLASVSMDKVTFIVSVTDDLLDRGFHAGNMMKQIAAAAGGGGGGKADMAQAGAKDPTKVVDAFRVAETLLSQNN